MTRDVVHDVATALLDSLEDAPPAKQGEILDVLARLVPAWIEEGRLGALADLLADLRRTATVRVVAAEHANALANVLRGPRIAEAVGGLLRDIQAGECLPVAAELDRFFEILGPVCFEQLVRAAEVVRLKDLRAALQTVVDRGVIAHPSAVDTALGSRDAFVLRAVLQRLQVHPDPSHLQRVGTLLVHSDVSVRESAIRVVVVSGGRNGLPFLRRALDDVSSEVRTAALWGLGVWRASDACADLEARLQDKLVLDLPAAERLALFEAYARAGGAKALPLLERILHGRSGWGRHWPAELRICAARVIGLTGAAQAPRLLGKACKDGDDAVRRTAHRALQRLGTER